MSVQELFFLLLPVALLIVIALALFLPLRRSHAQPTSADQRRLTGPIFRDDERYWFAGVFYYNPDDPDALVPKRFGIGWTINFAHPIGKILAALMIIMILLPLAATIFAPGLHSYGCHPSGCNPLP
ncbi:MAG TPA: DUF5808 domain-containing protein [Ktedonobacterales bacterium]|nr:DUF5808 domain-containing protein [Ktedonobacterales bacterium]